MKLITVLAISWTLIFQAPTVASSASSFVASTDISCARPISCGGYMCVALKDDGTAEAWGYSDYGGDASGVDLTDVTDISCGQKACVALKEDGTAEVWGDSNYGGDASGVDLTNV